MDEDLTELECLALAKLQAVLGEERGRDLLTTTLARHELRLHTPADLGQLGVLLRSETGFAAAVGSMLSVQATILAARAR